MTTKNPASMLEATVVLAGGELRLGDQVGVIFFHLAQDIHIVTSFHLHHQMLTDWRRGDFNSKLIFMQILIFRISPCSLPAGGNNR
jgi:hypothetical protein